MKHWLEWLLIVQVLDSLTLQTESFWYSLQNLQSLSCFVQYSKNAMVKPSKTLQKHWVEQQNN